MALNLTNIMTFFGRIGRNAYIINGAQTLQPATFNEIAAFGYVNPFWIAQLTQGYDSGIRGETSGMSTWVQVAQTFLLGTVAADNPAYGTSLPAALTYLLEQFQTQGKFVKKCTIGGTSTPDPANVGTGVVAFTLIRGDGVSLQNTVAESGTLFITADSYTGGAQAGFEPWRYAGAPNTSSLGTGNAVGLWDWDWPQGSGAGVSGRCVSSADNANTAGNLLTNGNFATWTGGTPALSYWELVTGTWGTSIRQSAVTFQSSPYSVEFIAGATLNELTQTFNSTIITGAGAGTAANIQANTGYIHNFWLKAAGVISGGVLTVTLVDGSGTVINDQSGTPNSQTYALTGHPTTWTNHNFPYRLPVILPAVVKLHAQITTALAGANLFWDDNAFAKTTALYPGGPSIVVFSNPATPFEAAPDPDAFTLAFTNNRAGATFGATFQTLINRLFQTPDLILPYTTGAPDFADTLITNA